MLSNDRVHHKPDPAALHARDHDLLKSRIAAGYPEILAKTDVGHDPAAHIRHVPAMGLLTVLRDKLDALLDQGKWKDEMLVPGPGQEPVDDRERKRQLERDRRAGSSGAADLDGPAEGVNCLFDHVDPHAPPG